MWRTPLLTLACDTRDMRDMRDDVEYMVDVVRVDSSAPSARTPLFGLRACEVTARRRPDAFLRRRPPLRFWWWKVGSEARAEMPVSTVVLGVRC